MNFNYRKYYKKYYGIEFGKEYEIHHIDLNRNNNNIDNLVLLPKELHARYHFYLNNLAIYRTDEKYKLEIDFRVHGNNACNLSYTHNIIKGLIETLNECSKWYDYKFNLDLEKQFKAREGE